MKEVFESKKLQDQIFPTLPPSPSRDEFIRQVYLPTSDRDPQRATICLDQLEAAGNLDEAVKQQAVLGLKRFQFEEKFEGREILITVLPSRSCAHTGLELLSGRPELVRPFWHNGRWTTSSELSNHWKGTWENIGGQESLGIFVREVKNFATCSDPRDMKKLLFKKFHEGEPFAILYEYSLSDTHNHCMLISSPDFKFGMQCERKKMRPKRTKKENDEAAKRRIWKDAALKTIIRSICIDDPSRAPYQNAHTEQEVSFALRLEKSRILGTPIPAPVEVRTMLGALTLTSRFKSAFPSFWKPSEQVTLQTYDPVRQAPQPGARTKQRAPVPEAEGNKDAA